VKIVAVGGYVAVSYLRNRTSTEDIDYILEPYSEGAAKVEEKLEEAITKVADDANYAMKWMNSNVGVYAAGDARQTLFQESIAQGVVLWQGKNLILYAAKWEWTLQRKLKRIASERRDVDMSDSVAILKNIVDANGAPLTRAYVKNLNTNIYTPTADQILDEVDAKFQATYGIRGII
jgi:hypothetical protein